MGIMAVVITSVPTLLVASRAAAERASNSLQTKELAMVRMHDKNSYWYMHGMLCKVHVKGLHKFSYKINIII